VCHSFRTSNNTVGYEMPGYLAGECFLLQVPQKVLGGIYGKYMSKFYELMQETETVLIHMRDLVADEPEKKEHDEVTDYVQSLYQALRQTAAEFAIFGAPRARYLAATKLLAIVEGALPDFVLEHGLSEEVDPNEGMGMDKVRLVDDFEEDATRT
ncbi:unnamed protein product, partial [Polarella glacialis]